MRGFVIIDHNTRTSQPPVAVLQLLQYGTGARQLLIRGQKVAHERVEDVRCLWRLRRLQLLRRLQQLLQFLQTAPV